LAHAIAGLADFAAHEAIFLEVGVKTGALLSAFVHQTVRGQAAGGVRHWPYATLGDFLRDGLRLARGMGRKNALAGIWWGGGKGVIARQGERALDQEYRRELYEEYGRFISSLGGCYVTAEDAGTTPTDMAAVFRTTRFVTCVPPQTGGSGNPSPATAKGVVCAMEAALDHLGAGSLAGKRVAMQGAGSVGAAMIADLLERNVASVVVTDMNHEQCAAVRGHFATAPVTVRWVPAGDASVFGEECDVLAPNALGGCLNPDTIARLRCRVVCGAANNQLEDEVADGRALHARHILYVPDFVANRMGIVSCANEQYGSLPADPSILRHFGRTWENAVYVITRKILEQATREGIPPGEAANAIADRLALEPHPIFPHRGWTIARALAEERWHEGQSSG
jgi:glutamate dehydrogenase/leucine dehydrogenase